MPNNINKVVFGNDTLIDLTNDTVSADNLLEGETAHDRGGSPIVGTAKQGHSILNKLGTLLTQRSKLKFGGMLRTTDDDTNGITVVSDEAEEIEWSVWSAMTEVEQNAYSAGKKIDILHAPSVQDNKVPKTDIATVESGSTASRAYSVGELVYVNGNLYKVITAIASGATFTVNTNIQSTNVSGKIKEMTESDGLHNLSVKSAVSVAEYFNYCKIGKLVIVNIGGISISDNSRLISEDMPIMRSRPTTVLNNNATGDVALVYGDINSNKLWFSGNNRENTNYYGQLVYITD